MGLRPGILYGLIPDVYCTSLSEYPLDQNEKEKHAYAHFIAAHTTVLHSICTIPCIRSQDIITGPRKHARGPVALRYLNRAFEVDAKNYTPNAKTRTLAV